MLHNNMIQSAYSCKRLHIILILNHPTWLSELITQIHAEHFHLSILQIIITALNEPSVHIMLPLVSETRSCMLTILKHTVFLIYLSLFCLFLLSFFFPGPCSLFFTLLFISGVSALAVEERAQQLQMKVHSCRPSASHDPQTDLKTKREVRIWVFSVLSPPTFSHWLFFIFICI